MGRRSPRASCSLAIHFALGAERRAYKAFDRLTSHSIDAPELPNITLISYSISFGTIVLIIAFWVLDNGALAPG